MTQPKINWQEPTSDRIQQTTVDGVPCWAFTILKADPPLPFDVANKNVGPGGQINRRAEISFAPADPKFKPQGPYNVKPGMTQTHGIRLRFKGGWPLNKGLQHDWKVYWQMHTPDDYKGNGYDGFHGISGHNGEITLMTPNDPNGGYFFHTPEQMDTWDAHNYLMAIKWSKGADGFVKMADATTKKILAQYNGPTFPAGPFGPSGEYMYGPLIGIYMDGISITSDATLYMAGFEGPLPDIWDGDLTVAAPATPPTPDQASTVQVYGAQLKATRDAMQKEVDAINAMLGKP